MKEMLCILCIWLILSLGVSLSLFFMIRMYSDTPEVQVKPDQNVTVDITPGCIDIQAPGFSGKCERCPEDCR